MVPIEQAGSDEVGHHHIHSVVLMRHQDAHHAHGTEQPAHQMVPPKGPRRILTEKKKRQECLYQTLDSDRD